MRFCRSAALAVLLASSWAASARADVVRAEPNDATVAGSAVIAVATVEAVEGKGPFTHAKPPAVVVRVKQAWKGSAENARLRITGWMEKSAVVCASNGHPLPADECRAREKERQGAAVVAPAVGSRHLLFLVRKGGGWQPYFNEWHQRVSFAEPSERLVALVIGLSSMTFQASRDLGAIPSGSPVIVRGTLTNVSKAPQTFDPALMVLSGQRPGRLLKAIAARPRPAAGVPEPIALAPGESREVAWDLTGIFPVSLAYPGRYGLSIELPARCTAGNGKHQDVDFIVTGKVTLDTAVESSPVVMVARAGQRVAQQGGRVDVVLSERSYLKSDGTEHEIPMQVAWPQAEIPLPPEGEWVIVCADGAEVRFAAVRTPDRLARVKALVSGRPPP